jgi:uncharacterized protein YjbJ (UPF0337 family)
LTISTTGIVALYRVANLGDFGRASGRLRPNPQSRRLKMAADTGRHRFVLLAGTSSKLDGFQHEPVWRNDMDWNRVEGNWKQTKGKIKEKWGQLTDDDLTQVNGKREQLEGKIQERYGIARDKARQDIDDWLKTMH